MGILTTFHLMTYQGMGIFPGLTANVPTQFWIATRYLEGMILALTPFAIRWQVTDKILLLFGLLWSFLTAGVVATILVYPLFPDCFLPGVGLTPFKIYSEYLIILILGISIYNLRKQGGNVSPRFRRLLSLSMAMTIGAELAFTLYTDVYGFFNLLGHLFQLASLYFIYKGIVEYGLREPHSLLAGHLRRVESHVQAVNDCFLSFGPDHRANMEKILETAGRLLGADYGLYNIIEEDQSRSQRAWKATTGFFEGFPWTDPLDHYGTPWEPMILTDLGAAAHTLHPALRELDIDTYIGYPIHVHGQLRGSFSLLYKKGKALNRQERAVLNTFARAFCVEVEREISEGQLRRLTAQQDLILATVPVQIWSLDRPDHIQFGNRAFAQFHGLATQQVTDISVDQIYPPRERVQVRNHNQSLLATGQRWRGEYATPDGHGGTRWLDVTKIPLTEGGAQQLICIATEITDRKRLEAVLQADLNRARRIHNTFLPRSFPKIPGLSIAAYYQPTAQLGGDYYDVRSLGSEHLIYLLDISGHGLDGALCSVFVRQTIRNYIDQVGSFHLPSILTHLQQVFAGAGFPGDYFITIQLLLLQGYQIQYTSAGMIHPPLSSHKGAYPLEPGPLISHFAVDVDYKVHQATIEPGETLLFYTDGVVEQRDQGGKMFGPEGILRAMEGGGDPQSCLQKVVKELKIHGGRDSFTDDISLLAIQRKE